MKNIILQKPKIEEYYYEKKLNEDSKTMDYNAGYDINIDGYHYDTGCIDFPKEKWKTVYEERYNKNKFFAYIKDCFLDEFVGYVNYQYNAKDNIYECGIVIESKYRNEGYSKDALRLLIKEAHKNKIDYLYDTFEKDRRYALKIFKDVGFEVDREVKWKKFNKEVNGVVLKINTNKVITKLESIKNLKDILEFMDENIRYGWLDFENKQHIGNMKNFRKLYRTMSIEDTLKYEMGTCIEQVNLMKHLLDMNNIKNKMFCTRIYESGNKGENEEEHIHCFILCYKNDKVYQIEYPNFEKKGIYEFESEKEALLKINKFYEETSGTTERVLTEYKCVPIGISFSEFNNYINKLEDVKI